MNTILVADDQPALVETMSSGECRDEISFLFDTLVHELNNVVLAIDGCAGLLRRDAALAELSRTYVGMILTGTNRLTRRLEDLRVLTRDGSETAPGAADLSAILREVVSESEAGAREREIEVSASVPSDPVPLAAPAAVTRTILRNIVKNAVKYNVRRGRVDIAVSRDETRGTVSVADTGIGIPAEAREAVFSRGIRLDRSGTPGMGLGLYIVRRLTERFGIDVELDSVEGKGSAFILRFPLSVSAWSQPQPAPLAWPTLPTVPTRPTLKGEKIG
ncbi:MAG: hypothetical protein A2V83_06715 [Nitrospirae bacterium RBG_16_64_22]|nr:MAG: hypothetical protein A2V83_06715 [Nitrospirae bacterium RBG_16_64_22]